MVVTDADLVRAGSLDELKQKGCLVVGAGGHTVAVFWHEDRAWAVDNRCPHMGFPLSRGTVCDGLLTCHWHNARFDLASGGTLDPFADDVRAFPVAGPGRPGARRRQPRGRRPRGPLAQAARGGAGGRSAAGAGQGDPGAAPGRHRPARDRPDRGALRRPLPGPRLGPGHDDPDGDGERPAGPAARRAAAGALPRAGPRGRGLRRPAAPLRPGAAADREPAAGAAEGVVPPGRRRPRHRRRRADSLRTAIAERRRAARPGRHAASPPPPTTTTWTPATSWTSSTRRASCWICWAGRRRRPSCRAWWTASAGPSAARSRRPGAPRST